MFGGTLNLYLSIICRLTANRPESAPALTFNLEAWDFTFML